MVLESSQGGALVMVMLIVCVLSVVAASMLLTTTTRYHTTYQSASWQEAIVGAEAGVDLAMTELRKRVVAGPSNSFLSRTAAAKANGGNAPGAYWATTYPSGKKYENYGRALSTDVSPYLLALTSEDTKSEGVTSLQARVFIDVPGSDTSPSPNNFAVNPDNSSNSFISQFDNPNLRDPDGVDRSRWWYRIRSLGIANVSGPPRPNIEKLDNRLRRFSLFTDWRTGQAVSSPQVTRMVEVLVQPQMNFRNALMADKRIDLSDQDVLVDSYDSSKGVYSGLLNKGNQGNIATNGQLINAGHATVNGNAMTNNGSINDGDNVTGQQSGNFYQELTPFTAGLLNPKWSAVQDGGTITGSTTYTASSDSSNPTLVRLDGINLPTGKVINIKGPAASGSTTATTPAYIKVYVQGDIATAGTGNINLAANVNAIFYVSGNINLQGSGIINNSFLGRQLVINGLRPTANSDGSLPDRTITVATTQDFEALVYAPNHDLNLTLQAVLGNGNSGGGSSSSGQITSLQRNIAAKQQELANLQTEYDNNMRIYNLSQGFDMVHYNRAQQNLTDINRVTQEIANMQTQLDALVGINPTSSVDDHARGYNGIYGGFVAKTIKVGAKTHVHYDETLRNAGPVNHYEIVNWFEDSVSHSAAAGGVGTFWWAGQ